MPREVRMLSGFRRGGGAALTVENPDISHDNGTSSIAAVDGSVGIAISRHGLSSTAHGHHQHHHHNPQIHQDQSLIVADSIERQVCSGIICVSAFVLHCYDLLGII